MIRDFPPCFSRSLITEATPPLGRRRGGGASACALPPSSWPFASVLTRAPARYLTYRESRSIPPGRRRHRAGARAVLAARRYHKRSAPRLFLFVCLEPSFTLYICLFACSVYSLFLFSFPFKCAQTSVCSEMDMHAYAYPRVSILSELGYRTQVGSGALEGGGRHRWAS